MQLYSYPFFKEESQKYIFNNANENSWNMHAIQLLKYLWAENFVCSTILQLHACKVFSSDILWLVLHEYSIVSAESIVHSPLFKDLRIPRWREFTYLDFWIPRVSPTFPFFSFSDNRYHLGILKSGLLKRQDIMHIALLEFILSLKARMLKIKKLHRIGLNIYGFIK
jgi:hypothetical protein